MTVRVWNYVSTSMPLFATRHTPTAASTTRTLTIATMSRTATTPPPQQHPANNSTPRRTRKTTQPHLTPAGRVRGIILHANHATQRNRLGETTSKSLSRPYPQQTKQYKQLHGTLRGLYTSLSDLSVRRTFCLEFTDIPIYQNVLFRILGHSYVSNVLFTIL